MRLTWYGHACFLVETGGSRLLIDPFLTGNGQAPVTADEVTADAILVTHGHADHLGDTVAIAKRCQALVVSNFEICNWVAAKGVARVHPQHVGGAFEHAWGRLKLTAAQHGSSLPDGSYGGNPCGLLLSAEGRTVYHAGDTGLFYDMKLIGDEGIDCAILPIGDNFTMGPEDALRAVQLLRPARVIPIHYNTFDVIRQDAGAWAERVRETTSVEVTVLRPGDSFELA